MRSGLCTVFLIAVVVFGGWSTDRAEASVRGKGYRARPGTPVFLFKSNNDFELDVNGGDITIPIYGTWIELNLGEISFWSTVVPLLNEQGIFVFGIQVFDKLYVVIGFSILTAEEIQDTSR